MKYNKKNMENFSLENILKTSKNNRGCGNISSHNSYLCTSSNPESRIQILLYLWLWFSNSGFEPVGGS